MKYIVLLILFLIQVMAFALGFILLLIINVGLPHKEALTLPCGMLFGIGTLSFIITQILLNLWEKDESSKNSQNRHFPF